jgi:hypothetical protein
VVPADVVECPRLPGEESGGREQVDGAARLVERFPVPLLLAPYPRQRVVRVRLTRVVVEFAVHAQRGRQARVRLVVPAELG